MALCIRDSPEQGLQGGPHLKSSISFFLSFLLKGATGYVAGNVSKSEHSPGAGASLGAPTHLSLLTESPTGLTPAATTGSVEGFEAPKELGVLGSRGSSCASL